MGQKKYREPVEFDVIQAAIQGDADSINQIIAYFQPYINARCRRKFDYFPGLPFRPARNETDKCTLTSPY